jgi:hypothetical protein
LFRLFNRHQSHPLSRHINLLQFHLLNPLANQRFIHHLNRLSNLLDIQLCNHP